MTTTLFDATHHTAFFIRLGDLDESDVRYLRGCVRYYLNLRQSLPTRYYVRNGSARSIPEDRAKLLQVLAKSFI